MLSFLILCCLTPAVSSLPYNETLARIMHRLASAAYSDDPAKCLDNTPVELVKSWKVESCNGHWNAECFGYLALVPGKAIAIVFSGTRTKIQLAHQTINFMWSGKLVNFYGMAKVNDYYYNAFKSLFVGEMEKLTEETIKKYPTYDIWLTGHSLGGGLASITAFYIKVMGIKRKEDKILLYTFGQPRIGNKGFAVKHDILVPNSFRITRGHDIVVVRPNSPNYYHHKTEIHYWDTMSNGSEYIVCEHNEDEKCALGRTGLSFRYTSDHEIYFEKKLIDWGQDGCPTEKVEQSKEINAVNMHMNTKLKSDTQSV